MLSGCGGPPVIPDSEEKKWVSRINWKDLGLMERPFLNEYCKWTCRATWLMHTYICISLTHTHLHACKWSKMGEKNNKNSFGFLIVNTLSCQTTLKEILLCRLNIGYPHNWNNMPLFHYSQTLGKNVFLCIKNTPLGSWDLRKFEN